MEKIGEDFIRSNSLTVADVNSFYTSAKKVWFWPNKYCRLLECLKNVMGGLVSHTQSHSGETSMLKKLITRSSTQLTTTWTIWRWQEKGSRTLSGQKCTNRWKYEASKCWIFGQKNSSVFLLLESLYHEKFHHYKTGLVQRLTTIPNTGARL